MAASIARLETFLAKLSWEILNQKCLSDIVVSNISNSKELVNKSKHPCDKEWSTSVLQARPYLHPDITQPSPCELRLSCHQHTQFTICQVVIICDAPELECYDRFGEHFFSLNGDVVEAPNSFTNEISSSITTWYRFVLTPFAPMFALTLKFKKQDSQPMELYLRHCSVTVSPYTWNSVNKGAEIPSEVIDKLKKMDLPPQAHALLATVMAGPISSFCSTDNIGSVNNQNDCQMLDMAEMRIFLINRFDAFQRHVDAKFNQLETRLSSLETFLTSRKT